MSEPVAGHKTLDPAERAAAAAPTAPTAPTSVPDLYFSNRCLITLRMWVIDEQFSVEYRNEKTVLLRISSTLN